MQNTPRSRRFLKITLIAVAVLVVVIVGLYVWFISNTSRALERMVATKSNNTLMLDVTGLRFNPYSHLLSVRHAELTSTDTVNQPVTYKAVVPGLTVRVSSIWSMIFYRQLLLDSIELNKPLVEVTRRQRVEQIENDTSRNEDGLSIAQEIGNVYNSMLDGLETFGINRIKMHDAGFRLTDLTRPELKPTFVNRINLDLKREPTNPLVKRDEHIAGAQSIDVRISDQDIQMPNGRHRLAFNRFKLELFRQRVVLDSCTLTAIETDSAKSSYTIFFDSLMLVGVDFGAMYRSNVLRADSVYCINPVFNVRIDNSERPVEVPDPNRLIRELTSDMDMAYLAVKDADIDLDIQGRKNRARVNSSADNFEIHGLRVSADSTIPVSVQQFDLRVRDYRLYNIDSTTVYAFDSVHFRNNTIALSNFSIVTTSHPTRIRNERSFVIPHFALTGLDWYELIFNQNLRAREAVLYHPDIRYTRNLEPVKQTQTAMIASLHTLDSLLTLERITIVNGRVFASLGDQASFEFEDVDLLMNSNRVLAASGVTELRDAVSNLAFRNGQIRYGKTTTLLQNVKSTKGVIHAGKLTVSSTDNSINAQATDVEIGNLLLDNKNESALVNGLRWSSADVDIRSLPDLNGVNGQKNSSIAMRNISGDNTKLRITMDATVVSTNVKSLRVAALDKMGNEPFRVDGVEVNGNDLVVYDDKGLRVTAKDYEVTNQKSFVNGLKIIRNTSRDSLLVESPKIIFNADANDVLANNLYLKSLEAAAPLIRYRNVLGDVAAAPDSNAVIPTVRIDQLRLTKPLIDIALHDETEVVTISMEENENGLVEAKDLRIDTNGFKTLSLSLNTSNVMAASTSGENFGVDSGKFNATVSNLSVLQRNNKLQWNALVDSLRLENAGGIVNALKSGQLQFDTMSLGNLLLSSKNITDYHMFVRENAKMNLNKSTGTYNDSTISLSWNNVAYKSNLGLLSLDSFVYRPTLSRDEYIERSPYQTDYLTFKTDSVQIQGIDATRFYPDSALTVQRISINKLVITAYRDKLPPFKHGIIKPLPTEMVKRIPFPLNVRRADVYNGFVTYTERHKDTRITGVIALTDMRGVLLNVKNYDLQEKDSLTVLMNTRLLDTVSTRVRVRQAYTDTLNTFRLTVALDSMPLTALNATLAPLMNVNIESGYMDSFRMRAVGRESISFGEALMVYDDLRVRLLKNADEKRRPLLRSMASWYINTFVIKNHNRDRLGLVYFERVRDRSFFNYILKMTVSGMATSVGAKRNEKYLKKYERTITREDLPPIDFEISDPELTLPEAPQTKAR